MPHHRSFGIKLVGIVAVVCCVAVALVCTSMVLLERHRARASTLRHVTSQANVVARSVEPSLLAGDTDEARESLRQLAGDPSVLCACLMLADGTGFAHYHSSRRARCSPNDMVIGYTWHESQLSVTVPVGGGTEAEGLLAVRYALDSIDDEMRSAMFVASGAGAISLLLGIGLALRLRRALTGPIYSLVDATERVTEEEDYSVRVTVASRDELGALTDAFNNMLEQIEHRDYQLADANRSLEQRVLERTKQMEEAMDDALAANRSKSDFLANMSHEIRTPMTAILGFGDLLLDPALSAERRDEHIRTIQRSGRHLLAVINGILDISKIEAGQMHVESIRCSPVEVVAEVASLMRVRAIEQQLEFNIVFDGPIPRTITSDPTRLQQILVNLVGNAIKFTEKGEVELTARFEDGEESRMHFEVRDSGIGIAPEKQQALFQPFQQADHTMTRRYGGSGLGLCIARELANLLGGDIEFESKEGEGSVFKLAVSTGCLQGVEIHEQVREVDLNAAEYLVDTHAPARGTACALPRPDGPAALRVLLAEDGPDNQRLITFHLERAGYTVEVAENGRIAYQRAREALASGQPFHVILMDMQMPEMDGYMVASKLRSEGYPLPIVALTAHAMAGDRERCLEAGCDDYVTKPINRELLCETVEKYGRLSAA